MAIKPVDFQVMIPRTIEASKASNDENQRNQALLQQQAASSQQRADNSIKQVYSRSNTQNVKINEKQKENSGNNKKKKGKAEDIEGKAIKKNLQTSTIDIKI
jgi:hypothetical protein